MHFPLTRIDILYWENITKQSENLEILRKDMDLSKYNKIFDGDKSIFHYFADNCDIIQSIRDKFNSNQVDRKDQYMPLVILNRDKNGNTALD
jgi:hypothetical protein